MDSFNQEKEVWKISSELKTYPVPYELELIKGNINIYTNTSPKPLNERLINKARKLHQQGNILEAVKYYNQIINQGCNDCRVFSNYGAILRSIGKLKEAEILIRKAIQIKPDSADLYSNLGIILKDVGKLKEAEISTRKAIKIKADYADAYYNLGNILIKMGELNEAAKCQRKAIKINPYFADSYLNLGNIMRDLGKLKEAERSTRKAIEIKPDLAKAYFNLGNILSDLGKLKEAESSLIKAIELNSDYSKAYYSLSLLKYSDENKIWKDKLFSENILIHKSQKDQVDIYFARANVLHREKKYEDSSKYLKLANKLKLCLHSSNSNLLISKSKILMLESDNGGISRTDIRKYPESIFIVGMPRSGSTLLESILSMNNDVCDLGEINLLEELFIEYKHSKQEINLAELYRKKINHQTQLHIVTNKWLYNYQYAGIIAQHLPNAKICHCYRNPLDNLLSIYRAHFAKGNEYSSSLVDCAKVYLDQEKVMTEYKNRFRSKIFDLNYDLLVSNPYKEIKILISRLGWEWDDVYLTPHLNPRSISTASNVQVRSPINSGSIGGWKNYKDMLKPAIEILRKNKRYKDITE